MLNAKPRIVLVCQLITHFAVAAAQESQQASTTPEPVVFDTQHDRPSGILSRNEFCVQNGYNWPRRKVCVSCLPSPSQRIHAKVHL
ncbi:hypothetical protein Enr13x_25100 [Stieleria neptunia]|uniref:Secreted protein n=1 Tax=Stieleria neptunia TaxID=2527979 RepID=A0A518HPA6_9BACT|nr:hypothetical protein Enr13x_25100 [Stieleria neptunia]